MSGDALVTIPRVGWQDFIDGEFRWSQGEHVGLIAPTQSGKTTLQNAILPARRWVAFCATKARDRTYGELQRAGFKRVETWPPPPSLEKVLVWPRVRTDADIARQQRVFAAVLRSVFATGGWCVVADELRYLTETLRLARLLELLWLQGSALGITVVAGTQRPAHVPLTLYDQSTHLFFGRDNDERNLKRISGIGYLSANLIRETVARLARHDFLYVNTRTGRMLITRVER